jgi:hypothetical protein
VSTPGNPPTVLILASVTLAVLLAGWFGWHLLTTDPLIRQLDWIAGITEIGNTPGATVDVSTDVCRALNGKIPQLPSQQEGWRRLEHWGIFGCFDPDQHRLLDFSVAGQCQARLTVAPACVL